MDVPADYAMNPLASEDPTAWDGLIAAVVPARMLVAIAGRMGQALRQHCAPEDVWQETLLLAWRDRHRCDWRGLPTFRSWLLKIAGNRIASLAESVQAQKRGGGVECQSIQRSSGGDDSRSSWYAGPIASTTPSRAASDAEEARRMEQALASLPEDLRAVVQLRVFEGLLIEDVAAQLGLGSSAVRHRLRRGAELFDRRLNAGNGSA